MIYYIKEPEYSGMDTVTARSKARVDAETIFGRRGYTPLELNLPSKFSTSGIKRLGWHLDSRKRWAGTLSKLSEQDVLIIQYPCTDFNLLLPGVIRQAKAKTVLLLHDWERYRHIANKEEGLGRRIKCSIEEKLLQYADRIIVHNDIMRSKMAESGIDQDKLISLGIFDYLIDGIDLGRLEQRKNDLSMPVIVAGNLTRQKAGYVYDLPEEPDFNLFGAGYDNKAKANIHYHGSFAPDDLPYHLKGSFGLVWDGPTSKTCSGANGSYLRINNPHKTSLYLSSGIPVIIWSEAALAGFVKENNCGITVDSLDKLKEAIANTNDSEYEEMRTNAVKLSVALRAGSYLSGALTKAESALV